MRQSGLHVMCWQDNSMTDALFANRQDGLINGIQVLRKIAEGMYYAETEK